MNSQTRVFFSKYKLQYVKFLSVPIIQWKLKCELVYQQVQDSSFINVTVTIDGVLVCVTEKAVLVIRGQCLVLLLPLS